MRVCVFKVPQSSPDDVNGLKNLIKTKQVDPTKIVAIIGKTEGNGCVNDFTRGFAVSSLKHFLSEFLNATETGRIVYVMSGGTEGVLSPHLNLFTCETEIIPGIPCKTGLAIGVHHTRSFLPEEIGRLEMVKVVAAGMERAMLDAGLEIANVHFVQVKCPLLKASSSSSHSSASVTQDSYKSMAYSRAASALGVAVAMKEVNLEDLKEDDICVNYDLYSSVASTSAGSELTNCEIVVMGNAQNTQSDFVIGHSVMQHALDTNAVALAIDSAKQAVSNGDLMSKLINVFAKAEADPKGVILGCRHTMLDDSDISHTRMARAVVGASIASFVQDPMIYVSGGAEHQGPSGGGPVAVIYQTK